MTFDYHCGLVFDFDGTVADTFQPSPNKIGVTEAYAQAVEIIFDQSGMSAYKELGGLKNRAPGELVRLLIKHNPGLEKEAATFFRKHYAKGETRALLKWPNDYEEMVALVGEMFVRAKMDILTNEISLNWPLPCAGFQKLCEALFTLRQKGVKIAFAILSSGHTPFIRRTFEIWGSQWPVFHPTVILSDDDLRPMAIPSEQKVKPHPFLFDTIEANLGFSRKRMMYYGDDPNKDGKLAMLSGVPFGLFDPSGEKTLPWGVYTTTRIKSWGTFADKLQANIFALEEGKLKWIS